MKGFLPFAFYLLTPAWSPNQDWAGYGLASRQVQRHCSRRQDPSWPPAMEIVQEQRVGSQAYRVHACCMGMGLPCSASNRCRCRSQCRASVRKITNATRASRAVPAWLETARPQMSRTRNNRLANALRARRNSLQPLPQAAFRAGSQAPRTGRFCSVKGGRPLMSNWP